MILPGTHLQKVVVNLPYMGPYDWHTTLRVFRLHQITPLETVGEDFYERVFCDKGKMGFVRVTHQENKGALKAEIYAENDKSVTDIEARLRRMFDLDRDVSKLDTFFNQFPVFHAFWVAQPGQRIASGWDAFEVMINTILGQLVSVKRANALMKQLIEVCGLEAAHPVSGAPLFLFPTPEILAQVDLSLLGTTQQRKKTIKIVSSMILSEELSFEREHIQVLKKKLLDVPGIGPWSAEYIALRALGDPDSFPATDLGIKKELEKHPDLHPEILKPYRSYVAVCLWNSYIKAMSKTL